MFGQRHAGLARSQKNVAGAEEGHRGAQSREVTVMWKHRAGKCGAGCGLTLKVLNRQGNDV